MSNKLLFFAFIATIIIFGFIPKISHAALINASGLLGQSSYTSSTVNWPTGSINASGFDSISSLALDTINHRLFVMDYSNKRILVFPLDTANNITTTTAQYVLGSCDFTSAGSGVVTSSTFGTGAHVVNLAYDSTNSRLFVTDFIHYRILAFNVATSTMANCEPATFVLGQINFTSSTPSTSQSGFTGPDDVFYDSVNSRLFVSDENNHRIMVFSVPGNATSSINGENAIFELGQINFTSSTAATTASGLNHPAGIAYDLTNSRLFVGDSWNSRIMVFSVTGNATSSINGENAINVLGQNNFTSSSTVTTQNGLYYGDDVAYDPVNNRLFVSDVDHKRIMIWNATSTITDGENAQNNMGQSDWISSSGGTSQTKFATPETAAYSYDVSNNRLFIYDYDNNRVLQFNFIHITTASGSLANAVVSQSYSQTINTTSSQGTLSFSLYSGSLPAGLSLNASTGVISGTSTQAITAIFTIEADDTFSTGPFFDRSTYTITSQYALAPTAVSDSGGMPSAWYNPPQTPIGGFSISINNGNQTTTNSNVTLNLKGGPDTARMAISNTPDFAGVSQENYTTSKSWNLCVGFPSCLNGTHFVYVKFYAPWGTASDVVFNSITLNTNGSITSSNQTSTSTSIQDQINALILKVSELRVQLSNLETRTLNFNFIKPLYFGLTDNDVKNLQTCLKTDPLLYPEGLITGYFGNLTKKAVGRFQEKYNLASPGDYAYGYVGPKTRTKLNELCRK